MPTLLQIDFKFPTEMMGDALTEGAKELANSINQEPGFISKIWTENAETGEAGGIYVFTDKAFAEQYAHMHSQRVAAMGATEIRTKIFDINTTLTDINRGQYTA
ncbi:monooxygenase [Oceanisphaera sediminis]|uniref:Monooxygenase n=1 Tax=Oceanisphaera sediminis TaxID=981381 RepID=A0ABP7EPV5_9GAMM